MNDGTIKKEVAERYAAFDRRRQEVFLAKVASWLTIEGRTTYAVDGPGLANPEKTRAVNEAIHRVLSHLTHLMAGNEQRRPDDVLIEMMVDLFRVIRADPKVLLELL